MKNTAEWDLFPKDISENQLMRTVISNDSHLLKEVSKKLINRLRDERVPEDMIFDVHVAFEEALRNAMIHGNMSDPDKKVIVDTDIRDDRLVITVEDEGPGFDPGSLPDPTLDENLLKERGRGVYLINNLMDEVSYQNRGRRVVMTKYFRTESGQEDRT